MRVWEVAKESGVEEDGHGARGSWSGFWGWKKAGWWWWRRLEMLDSVWRRVVSATGRGVGVGVSGGMVLFGGCGCGC